MMTIREEKIADVVAREALLDAGLWRGAFHQDVRAAARRPLAGGWPVAGRGRARPDRRHGAALASRGGSGRAALLLGPLAVHPDHRNRGIGSALVRRAITRARLGGHRAVLLVGDAPYYGRFGFTAAQTGGLWMPGRFERDRLLALELKPDALAGARGMIGATGAAAPVPSLNALVADFGHSATAKRRAA